MATLEKSEWCNFWWEQTDKDDKPRVLLVGDSITVGYRPFVNQRLAGKAYANMVGTSRAIDNRDLRQEIDYVLSQSGYTYEVIHFNNGLHGWHLSDEAYAEHLARTLDWLDRRSVGARIVLALSTPVWVPGQTSELDGGKCRAVDGRNAAARRQAERLGLAVNDLHAAMIEHSNYRTDDGYHYNEEGKSEQARIVSQFIEACIGEV